MFQFLQANINKQPPQNAAAGTPSSEPNLKRQTKLGNVRSVKDSNSPMKKYKKNSAFQCAEENVCIPVSNHVVNIQNKNGNYGESDIIVCPQNISHALPDSNLISDQFFLIKPKKVYTKDCSGSVCGKLLGKYAAGDECYEETDSLSHVDTDVEIKVKKELDCVPQSSLLVVNKEISDAGSHLCDMCGSSFEAPKQLNSALCPNCFLLSSDNSIHDTTIKQEVVDPEFVDMSGEVLSDSRKESIHLEFIIKNEDVLDEFPLNFVISKNTKVLNNTKKKVNTPSKLKKGRPKKIHLKIPKWIISQADFDQVTASEYVVIKHREQHGVKICL